MRTHKTAARRRGISIAEAAVALAVIMIVSAAAATFIVRAVDTETEVAHAMERSEQLENAIECYRWADGDAGKFKEALSQVGYEGNGYALRFTLTESDYINVALTTDINGKLTGIVISGPKMDEVNYG